VYMMVLWGGGEGKFVVNTKYYTYGSLVCCMEESLEFGRVMAKIRAVVVGLLVLWLESVL
jgi:hypothetical protein